MAYIIKNPKKVSKKDVDKVMSDLEFPKAIPKVMESISLRHRKSFIPVPFREIRSFYKVTKKYSSASLGGEDKIHLAADSLEESFDESLLCGLSELGESREAICAAAETVEKIETGFEKKLEDIEEIIRERWRYLVMQFGGVFLTEIRPNKCFIGNKSLADMLINYNKEIGKYGLNLQLLENYLKENSNGSVQIHFSDIMFNPKTKDYDIFSVTSGDIGKANIFLDLAKFLCVYNKDKETIIPVHLPYYEKWKTAEKVVEFGSLDENGERDALFNAEKVLRYLSKKWSNKNVKLALETGNGRSKRNGQIAYALLYDPFYFQTLMKGRKNFVNICEDVGHLNLENAETDWKDYLMEPISEFHVSGNNGKEDQHTIATPKTLKNYFEIMSFLKFYSGNICAEIGKGKLTADEFLKGVKDLAYTLFSEPTKQDFESYKDKFPLVENQVGNIAVITRNGRKTFVLDLFDRHGILEKYHKNLISSYALEAGLRVRDKVKTSELEVRGFLDSVDSCDFTSQIPISIGEDYKITGTNLQGSVLFYNDTPIYMDFFTKKQNPASSGRGSGREDSNNILNPNNFSTGFYRAY